MVNIFSFDNHLMLLTGAHRVLVDIHNALRDEFHSVIVGTIPYDKVNPVLGIEKGDYIQLKSVFQLRNSILFLHQRRWAVLFNVLNKILFLHSTVIYVHHNILKGHKKKSLFPDHIITISDSCVQNLTEYFGVPLSRIIKIHNAVPDISPAEHRPWQGGKIKILYPASISHVKRQLQIYGHLKNHLSQDIEIIFAGSGEEYEKLNNLTRHDPRFTCLGFVENIKELLANVDYCMLFSEYEGLPIALIEATMMGVPIICNDVGGNLEVAKNGYNALICNNWSQLISCLDSLQRISLDEYSLLSRNSRLHYLENFTYDRFKESYINYIRKLGL